jgi:hypothetical protein
VADLDAARLIAAALSSWRREQRVDHLTIVSASTCVPLALPKATNDLVYATAGYEQSIRNAAQVSLTSDMVFSDGASLELATISGSVAGGLTAALTVAVNA